VALKELHEDPDRVRAPLVKRDGRFAAALAIGNPTVHKMGLLLYVTRLARALGTRNVFSASTLDQMPKQLSSGLMFGHLVAEDLRRRTGAQADFLLQAVAPAAA